ncbi:hypothetical protein WDW37_10730 [Bdellovibrionota bacterium FG-1]
MKNGIAILALAFVLVPSASFAKPPIMMAFKATYPTTKLAVNCKVCHTTPPQLNPYGLDVQKTKAADGKFDFKTIESLDSDADGVSNLDEINVGTNPGDKDSH